MREHRVHRLTNWLTQDLAAEPELGLTSFEHAVQCAELARLEGADDEVILAALLHDVGHAEAGYDHGRWARVHLSGWFSERSLWLIEHHITAKRYFCAVAPEYFDTLSADSQRTYVLQGGALSSAEALDFSRHPWFDDVMRLREWDDLAKVGGWLPRPFEDYVQLIERELSSASGSTRLARSWSLSRFRTFRELTHRSRAVR
jgi:predicted HD phosphohydrolase